LAEAGAGYDAPVNEREARMYIGIGTILTVLLIILILVLVF
jgi:hypothetical protein